MLSSTNAAIVPWSAAGLMSGSRNVGSGASSSLAFELNDVLRDNHSHTSDLGYLCNYVTEATLTFPMTGPPRREWAPEEIKARTELVLDDRFARIMTVEEALAAS